MPALLLGILLALLPALAPVAAAHPLGNFTVNRYARLDLTPGQVLVHYVLDMAEIPTFQENAILDRDRDGRISAAEAAGYAAAKAEEIRRHLRLTLSGAPAILETRERHLGFSEGQGGLPTLRLEVLYVVPYEGAAFDAAFSDSNEPSRLGWREIVVRAGEGVALISSTAPAVDVTDELRRYPDDLLSSPLDRREARFSFRAAPAGTFTPTSAVFQAQEAPAPFIRAGDAFTALATGGDLGPGAVLLALLAAVGLGAIHALSPGHGKTVIGAYLVGSRGSPGHALFLGLTVTATHTLGVYALGLVTLFASAYVLPERLYPWLSLVSGLLVVAVGGSLLLARLRMAWAEASRAEHARGETGRSLQSQAGDSATAVPSSPGPRHGESPLETFPHHGGKGGGLPSPIVGEGLGVRELRAPQAHDSRHNVDLGNHGYHRHGGEEHSHLPPGADGSPVTWRALLALGISGGLLPCPSALVLMLSAIALHRVAFGLLLIVAFSVGLAGVLVGIGLALVLVGRALSGVQERIALPGMVPVVLRVAPALGALVVVLAGLAMTVQSLGQL